MPIIRSSDIGTYLYCNRAWWYKKQGIESANRSELAAGTELHVKHGRQVLASSISRMIGLVLLMIAIIMLVAYCSAQVL
jgi:CRISPR/Cas system-associated exonuclease Cas4 (RecB family)